MKLLRNNENGNNSCFEIKYERINDFFENLGKCSIFTKNSFIRFLYIFFPFKCVWLKVN